MVIDVRRIRTAREARGMEREALAKVLGLTEWKLWEVEKGKRECTRAMQLHMAMSLSYRPSFFEREHPDYELGHGSLLWHAPEEDVCSKCRNALTEAVCDYPVGNGKTCDLSMCFDCRNRVTAEIDYCYQHAKLFPVLGGGQIPLPFEA